MMFSPAGVVRVGDNLSDFDQFSDTSTNFIIYDMGGTADIVPTSDISASVIVLSSANARHFALFQRDFSDITLFMKTWIREEIEDARQHIYKEPELSDFLLRYRDLGGVPRYVFKPDRTHKQVVDRFFKELPFGGRDRETANQSGPHSIGCRQRRSPHHL